MFFYTSADFAKFTWLLFLTPAQQNFWILLHKEKKSHLIIGNTICEFTVSFGSFLRNIEIHSSSSSSEVCAPVSLSSLSSLWLDLKSRAILEELSWIRGLLWKLLYLDPNALSASSAKSLIVSSFSFWS